MKSTDFKSKLRKPTWTRHSMSSLISKMTEREFVTFINSSIGDDQTHRNSRFLKFEIHQEKSFFTKFSQHRSIR